MLNSNQLPGTTEESNGDEKKKSMSGGWKKTEGVIKASFFPNLYQTLCSAGFGFVTQCLNSQLLT